ncbi:MAG TPA: DUF4192 domain-containing protein [Segeticoccus sp.]|nr:DUF4192 domain-containing protein [Segeticoccus sp.]
MTPTTPSEPHPQRLAGPGQLIAYLPYQLGYHPRCSAVVVCWRTGRLGLVQRADLPEPGQEGEAAALLVPVLLRERPSAITLIGFEEGADPGASGPVLELVAEECAAAGIELQDHLVVRSSRWCSLLAGPGSAAGDGRPVPPPERVPAVLAMITCGVDPAPSREELEERLAGGRPLLERAVRAEAELLLDGLPGSDDAREAACWREDGLFAWARVLGGVDPCGTEPVDALRPVDLARAAVALVDVQLRDALIAWLTPDNLPLDLVDPELMAQVRRRLWPVRDDSGRSDGPDGPDDPLVEREEAHIRGRESRLADFCRVLPPEWAVGPLTVLAAHAWWRGDGALARIALERALDTDPGYRLAGLLLQLVDHGVRPDPDRRDRPPSDSAA